MLGVHPLPQIDLPHTSNNDIKGKKKVCKAEAPAVNDRHLQLFFFSGLSPRFSPVREPTMLEGRVPEYSFQVKGRE